MTHTKGPWAYSPNTKTIRSHENYWIATMDSWDGAVNHEANAALIAESPNLLEQLKQTVASLEYWFPRYGDTEGANSQMMKNARAAIAAVEGGD